MDYKIITINNETKIKDVDNIDYSHNQIIVFHNREGVVGIVPISQVIEIISEDKGNDDG